MYVYFIRAFGRDPMVKIGLSKDPGNRLAQLQTGSPVRLKLLGVVECRDGNHALAVEREAHRVFEKQRRRGEWFKLSKGQMKSIKSVIKKCAA